MPDSEQGKEQCGEQDDSHGAPAVEGVQQAHDRVLIFKGTGFHNGAYEHLNEAAADSIDYDTDHDADERIGKQVRDKSKPGQAGCGGDFRSNHAAPVTDPVHKPGTEQINQQLRDEKGHGDQGYFSQGDAVISMKFQEQQGCKIGGDCLGNKAQITGQQGFPVILLHGVSSRLWCRGNYNLIA